jgi:Holliday junction resolvase RusA-like endonuclease
MFHVQLPMPPSINRAFRNVPGRGRVKTRDYRKWRDDAVKLIHAQVRADKRIGGNVAVTISLSATMRGDADNRIKGILDALVDSGRIDDDRHVTTITVRKNAPGKDALVWVDVDGVGVAAMAILNPRREAGA